MSVQDDLIALVRDLQWTGCARGQGSGPMSSGGDGPLVRACPLCRGIDPSDPYHGHFMPSAIGHQVDCRLARALATSEKQP